MLASCSRQHLSAEKFRSSVLNGPIRVKPQTAKPSAIRNRRLCLRPPDLTAPPPSHGIGRVVELAVRGLKHQPEEESITLAHWFVVAKK
jgi:hypothetical protein